MITLYLQKDTKDEGGLYFDGREVSLACTAGTPVGAKLANAFAKCFEAKGAEAVEIVATGSAAEPLATASQLWLTGRGAKEGSAREFK